MNQYKVTDSVGNTYEIEADFVRGACDGCVSFIVESGKDAEIVVEFQNPISWHKVANAKALYELQREHNFEMSKQVEEPRYSFSKHTTFRPIPI